MAQQVVTTAWIAVAQMSSIPAELGNRNMLQLEFAVVAFQDNFSAGEAGNAVSALRVILGRVLDYAARNVLKGNTKAKRGNHIAIL